MKCPYENKECTKDCKHVMTCVQRKRRKNNVVNKITYSI